MNQKHELFADAAKTGSVLSLLGFSSWAEAASAAQAAASIAAFILSLLFIYDWFWKRFLRDVFVRRGWAKPLRRRNTDDFGDDSTRPGTL